MKKSLLALALVCTPSLSWANDWDLVTQIGPISVYFDRQSVAKDPSLPNHTQGDLVFLLKEPQSVHENGRTIVLDYFRFTHTYDCATPYNSHIVKMDGGLVAQPDQVEHVPNPTLRNKHTEFDTLRWDLVCGPSPTSKPTYTGSLQQLARQNNKHNVRAPHTKMALWSVARNTTQVDMLNHTTIKKISKDQYSVEFYNIRPDTPSEYGVYQGVLDCSAKKYILNTAKKFDIHEQDQTGVLNFDYLVNKKPWSLDFADNPDNAEPMDKTMQEICSNTLGKPAFKATIVQILEAKEALKENTEKHSEIQKALQDTQVFVPFEFQNK